MEIGDEVAVYIPGIELPLYGTLVYKSGERYGVQVVRGSEVALIEVNSGMVRKWRRGKRYD